MNFAFLAVVKSNLFRKIFAFTYCYRSSIL